jgi:3-phosphoglycerate kinase
LFSKKTIRDIDLTGKTVLLHAELDAPLTTDGKKVISDFRIKSSLPTIHALLEANCKIIIISKVGRPGGKPNPALSLFAIAKELQKLLEQEVEFVPNCIGEQVKKAAARLKARQVLLLENLRFHPEEEKNDEAFARTIVKDTGAELFVQDCFALSHRKEAGTDAITHFLPSIAGLALEKEVDTITNVMLKPQRPLVAVVGGAKIADKIDILQKFIEIADFVAIGGAMANTFLAAEDIDVAASLYDKADLPTARQIMAAAKSKAAKQPFVFALPRDAVVAHKVDKTAPTRIVDWSTHIVTDIEHYPKRPPLVSTRIEPHEMILDIGPFSAAFVAGAVQLAGTVVWNGAMGVTETPGLHDPIGPTAHGTELLMEAMLGEFGHRPFTVVGGGDTVGYIENRKMVASFDHVSTGGGASLELMAGRKLPGVEALEDK